MCFIQCTGLEMNECHYLGCAFEGKYPSVLKTIHMTRQPLCIVFGLLFPKFSISVVCTNYNGMLGFVLYQNFHRYIGSDCMIIMLVICVSIPSTARQSYY